MKTNPLKVKAKSLQKGDIIRTGNGRQFTVFRVGASSDQFTTVWVKELAGYMIFDNSEQVEVWKP